MDVMKQTTLDPGTTPDRGVLQDEIDGLFIGAMICLVLGGILLIIGFVRLIVWGCRVRQDKRLKKKKVRHLEHMRYLEEYSIQAGDSPNDVILNNNTPAADNDSVFKWDQSLVNMGYVTNETLERHSPKEPKLSAHMNGSSLSFSRPRSQPGSVSGMSARSSTGSVASGHGSVNSAQQHRQVSQQHEQENGSINRQKDNNMSRESPSPFHLADIPV